MRSHFWAFWFCHVSFDFSTSLLVFRELFGFAVSFLVLPRAFLSYLVLPWAIWFCRALFDFAVSYLVLSLAFWFFRELFGFALSFLVFPWAIWFRRDLFGFTITVVGHRTNGPLVIMGHVTFFFFNSKKKTFILLVFFFSFLFVVVVVVVFFFSKWKKIERKENENMKKINKNTK